jgi:hypothetical protein
MLFFVRRRRSSLGSLPRAAAVGNRLFGRRAAEDPRAARQTGAELTSTPCCTSLQIRIGAVTFCTAFTFAVLTL